MGALWRWQFSREFLCRFPVMIETGTGRGDGARYAAAAGFPRVVTIEVDRELYARVAPEFSFDERISILHGTSQEWLGRLLRGTTAPIFFWLDAHFPGHDFGEGTLDKETDIEKRLPLELELWAIRHYRPDGNWCILADDLRIYADGEWGDGNLSPAEREAVPAYVRDRDFFEPFRATHAVEIFTEDAGYALIVPHGCPRPKIIR